jgi:membrane protein
MMTALNVAYCRNEERGIIAYNLIAFLLTLLFLVFGLATLLLLAVIPAVLALLPMPDDVRSYLSNLRWPLQILFISVSIGLLFRFGPHRRGCSWKNDMAGVVVATLLWMIGSVALSIYVGTFADYDHTYGSIGAIIILLLWLWLCAYALLVGATLNSVTHRNVRCQVASLTEDDRCKLRDRTPVSPWG